MAYSRKSKLSGYRHRRPGKQGCAIVGLVCTLILIVCYMRSTGSTTYNNVEYRKVIEQNRFDFQQSKVRAVQKIQEDIIREDEAFPSFTLPKNDVRNADSDADYEILDKKVKAEEFNIPNADNHKHDEHVDKKDGVGDTDMKVDDVDTKHQPANYKIPSTKPDDKEEFSGVIKAVNNTMIKPQNATGERPNLNETKLAEKTVNTNQSVVVILANKTAELKQSAVSTFLNKTKPVLDKLQSITDVKMNISQRKLIELYNNTKLDLKTLANLTGPQIGQTLPSSAQNGSTFSVSGYAQKLTGNETLAGLSAKVKTMTDAFNRESVSVLSAAKNLTEQVKLKSTNQTTIVLEQLAKDASRIKADLAFLQANNASRADITRMESFMYDINEITKNVGALLKMKEYKEMQQSEH